MKKNQPIHMRKGSMFGRFAKWVATQCGSPWAFAGALTIVLLWATTGPIFKFSETWQLMINTGTTIITFLMVFVIQNTQNKDTCAMQLKLDELIRVTQKAHNALIDLEELNEDELAAVRKYYLKLAGSARERLREDINTADELNDRELLEIEDHFGAYRKSKK